ncbi:MAG: Ig-like domain-containing protein [Nitrosopumilaceae archaeon]
MITIIISGQSTSIIAQDEAEEVDVILLLEFAPSVVEAGEATYSIGYVKIVDSYDALPILAPRDLKITLISSDPSIASVPNQVVIPFKQDYAKFDVTVSTIEGTTEISAIFQDQIVAQTFRVGESVGEFADDLVLEINLPTNEMHVNSMMPFSVFLNGTDGIVQAPEDIMVSFDYEDSLVVLDDKLIIKRGSYYALGTVKTLGEEGNAFIKASTQDPKLDTVANIEISSSQPAKLKVDVWPRVIGMSEENIDIFVSLLDADDLPTKATQDIKLKIFADDEDLDDRIEDDLKPYGPIIKEGQFGFYLRQDFDFLPIHLTDIENFDTGEEDVELGENETRDITLNELRCLDEEGEPLAEEDEVCIPAGITIGASAQGLTSDTDAFIIVDTLGYNDPKASDKQLQFHIPDEIPSDATAIMVYQITTLEKNNNDEDDVGSDVDDPIDHLEEAEYYPVQSGINFSPARLVDNLSVVSNDTSRVRIVDAGNILSSDSYGTAILASGGKTGKATISTILKGLGSGSITTNVVNPSAAATTKIFSPAGSDKILFNNEGYADIFFMLIDSNGRPTTSKDEIKYLLKPINQLIEIPSREYFVNKQSVIGSYGRAAESKLVEINADPVGISAVSMLEVTSSFIIVPPSVTLQVIIPFENIAGANNENRIGVVQLIDDYENPISLPFDLKVKLGSNNTEVIQVPSSVTIASGASFVEFPVTTFGNPGFSAISASAELLHGSEAILFVEPYYPALNVYLQYLDTTIEWNKEAIIDIFVEDEYGLAVEDATVRLTAGTNSTVSPATVRTDEDGIATVTFKADTDKPTTSLTAEVSKDGYEYGEATIDLTVTGFTQEGGGTIFGLPFWVTYAGIAGIVGGIAVVAFMILRKPKPTEEELAEEEGGEI